MEKDSIIKRFRTVFIVHICISLILFYTLYRLQISSALIIVGISTIITLVLFLTFLYKIKSKLTDYPKASFYIYCGMIDFGFRALIVSYLLFYFQKQVLYAYDSLLLGLFCISIGLFLFYDRKKLVKDGPMFLYKTKIGLRIIDYLGKKYPKILKVLSYLSIFFGYILMLSFFYMIYAAIKMFMNPEFVKLIKIPPVMPLVPYLPEALNLNWLPSFPFTYWIIGIALVAIFHEAFHGIFARFNNIRIKSTGFGFLGPFLAFFVEQDNNQMKRAKPFAQMSVLSAGVFANLILALIFFLIMGLFFHAAYAPSGILVKGYLGIPGEVSILDESVITSEIINVEGINLTKIRLDNLSYFIIQSNINQKLPNNTLIMFYPDLPAIRNNLLGKVIIGINEDKINRLEDLERALSSYSSGDSINISVKYSMNKTQIIETIEVKFSEINSITGRPLLGISMSNPSRMGGLKGLIARSTAFFKDPNIDYTPKINPDLTSFINNLFWWMLFINISVAIVNMMPVPLFDGGQFFYLTILAITKKEKIAKKALKYISLFILGLFIFLTLLWAIGFFR